MLFLFLLVRSYQLYFIYGGAIKKKYLFTVDFIIYLLCLVGIYNITQKADIPFYINQTDNKIIIKDIHGGKILSIDGQRFSSREALEIYLDGKSIGENIKLTLENAGNINKLNVQTIPFYKLFYIITVLLIGTLFFIIAILVFIRSTDKKPAGYFHWVVIGTAVIMMTTWGNYHSLPLYGGLLLRIVFHLAYLITPVIFLNFIFAFPLSKENNYKILLSILYTAALIIALLQIITFYYTAFGSFSHWVGMYIQIFNIGRIFIISCILLALIVFIIFYISTISLVEKKKLKWLLLGYIIGPGSFVFLWVLPQAVTGMGLIREEFVIILMLAIPASFGISIVRYHIMDIDLLLNRSFVYSIVIGCLLIIYILLVTLSTSLIGNLSREISTIAAIFIALLFQPTKFRVQRFVDLKFFRINYNFRLATNKLLNEITSCNNNNILAERIIKEINNLIPTENSAFILLNHNSTGATILAHNNTGLPDNGNFINFNEGNLVNKPIAIINSVEHGTPIDIDKNNFFVNKNFSVAFPIKSATNQVFAYLLLGRKKSALRFTIEDIDLLSQVSKAAGIKCEKIILDDKLLMEQFEKNKLEELNQVKSSFVSNVSHEFKTPLTSIKIFAEIIRSKESLSNVKKDEYCNIIEGECNRLTRMIDNVLDVVKIEKGIKQYNFEEIDLLDAICNSIKIMEYQFKMKNITVISNFEEFNCSIMADRDAVIEAIVNILSNAVKYSSNDKEVRISLYGENNNAVISIEDKGFGISSDDLGKIFEPYYRAGEHGKKIIAGTGLGLSIVKHVMDAHKGKIEVYSKLGEGSCFKLYFPFAKL